MKNKNFIIVLALFAYLFSGCGSKHSKTVENLKAAYNGESTASAKYTAFAEQALKEGEISIAKMFLAASKAEAIHAENHRKVLKKMGENIEKPSLAKFEVKSTGENLADGIKGESYEIAEMYPSFIKTALEENNRNAKKSFTWALDTEKKHKDFYQKALVAYESKNTNNLEINWYVCPVCGNTYDKEIKGTSCDFCNTSKKKFIQV